MEYCKVICEKFKLYDNACMQTEVTSTDWDEVLRWTSKQIKVMNLGLVCRSFYGPLNRPKLLQLKE